MCGIVASFDKETLKDLFAYNSYRGELSYSLASFNTNSELQVIMKGPGKMPENFIDNYPMSGDYYIGHTQAPTTEAYNIHPASYKGSLLWHNGIIKQGMFEGPWDTEFILKSIIEVGYRGLSTLNGTFACIHYINNKLFVFRNEICPLFYDDNLNFSSTKFPGSKPLRADIVWEIDLLTKTLQPGTRFTTLENPYYFEEN